MFANTKLPTSLVSNTELSKFLGCQQTIYTLTSPLLPSTMGVPSISLVSEMQKTQKITFRLQATSGKRRKQAVACGFSSKIAKNSVSLAATGRKRRKTFVARERNAEFAERRPSSADETWKTLKTTRRRPTKHEKGRKTLVVGRRNVKNTENSPSSANEMLKTRKTVQIRE